MELLVISLASETERRRRLIANLDAHGLRCEWLDAVDARGWDQAQKQAHMNQASVFFNMSYEPNAGAVGCYLSHIKAFERLMASDKEAVLIVEDDAEFSPEFTSHLPCLAQAINALDIIFLCDRRPNRRAKIIGTSQKGLAFQFKRFANIGTNGYVINRKAAAYMLEHHTKFGLEIDMCLNRWWQSNLKIAVTSKDLVKDAIGESTIGYQNLVSSRNPARRLCANLFRLYLSLLKRAKYETHFNDMKTAFEKAHRS